MSTKKLRSKPAFWLVFLHGTVHTERFTQNYFTQKPRSMLLFVIEYVNLHVKSLERENCSNFHTLRRKNTRNLRAFDEQARFCRIALDPCS